MRTVITHSEENGAVPVAGARFPAWPGWEAVRSAGMASAALIPILAVNSVAVIAQLAFLKDHLTWSRPGDVLFAAALESVAVYLALHAHMALLAGDSAFKLRLASYLFGAVIGTMNYSHYAGPHWRPTFTAAAVGLMSASSPWLWAIHSRRQSRDKAMALGLIEPRAVRLGSTRWTWHPIRSAHVMWLATWAGVQSPAAAIALLDGSRGRSGMPSARPRENAPGALPAPSGNTGEHPRGALAAPPGLPSGHLPDALPSPSAYLPEAQPAAPGTPSGHPLEAPSDTAGMPSEGDGILPPRATRASSARPRRAPSEGSRKRPRAAARTAAGGMPTPVQARRMTPAELAPAVRLLMEQDISVPEKDVMAALHVGSAKAAAAMRLARKQIMTRHDQAI